MTNDTLAPTDPRTLFAQAVVTARTAIAAVGPEQLDLPTPCPDYDVRTLLGHMVIALRRMAALGNGTDPMAMPDHATGVPDDAWVATFVAESHEVQLAWSDAAKLDQTMVLPWATAPGSVMMAMYAAELVVHTWDLALATGRPVEWPEPTVQFALDWAFEGLPAGDREAAFAAMAADMPHRDLVHKPPFRNAIEVAPDAPAIDRLVGWFGRRP